MQETKKMKSFRQYAEFRDEGLGNFSGPENNLDRVFKILQDDHKDELMQFLNQIARKDGRIREELEQAGKTVDKKPVPSGDMDTIAPSGVDSQGDFDSNDN